MTVATANDARLKTPSQMPLSALQTICYNPPKRWEASHSPATSHASLTNQRGDSLDVHCKHLNGAKRLRSGKAGNTTGTASFEPLLEAP